MRFAFILSTAAMLALSACASPAPAAPESAFIQQTLSETATTPVRGELDRPPRYYDATLARYRAAEAARRAGAGLQTLSAPGPLAIYYDQIQWNKRRLTVAFNGGDEATYRLIEKTAQEWTHYSPGRFSLSFRDGLGRFRHWTDQDTAAAADIRISFRDDEEVRGYWSAMGTVATYTDPNKPTMNYGRMVERAARYVNDPAGWRASYEHSTILHEFGHALGLAHEHYHRECQVDIKFDSDPGYQPTFDRDWYAPDANGLSPGVVLYYQSPGNGAWTAEYSRWSVDAAKYFDPNYAVFSDPHIDADSVMMYDFPHFVLTGGDNSPCLGKAPFATELSPHDIAYFQAYYNVRLPRPAAGARS